MLPCLLQVHALAGAVQRDLAILPATLGAYASMRSGAKALFFAFFADGTTQDCNPQCDDSLATQKNMRTNVPILLNCLEVGSGRISSVVNVFRVLQFGERGRTWLEGLNLRGHRARTNESGVLTARIFSFRVARKTCLNQGLFTRKHRITAIFVVFYGPKMKKPHKMRG
jgi:hypothetical protein